MKQFMTNNKDPFRDLEECAKGTCIRFKNQEMPPGSNPDHADIGFEIDEGTGTAKLLVNLGIRYNNGNPDVSEWFRAGVKQFHTFAALRDWINGPLKQAFITDISAVQRGIINKPIYFDEDALFERLQERIIGQENALKILAGVVARHCARRRPARPVVVFAVGPSGVGKTMTAEMLANELCELDKENNGYQFLRLDMSEYQEAHCVSQKGVHPMDIGFGKGSQLVYALQANPRTIVLFDEIEKAHIAILHVLMNAMDSGRLSTAFRSQGGRGIDCHHAVFMFTSNLDSRSILDELENRNAFGNKAVEDEVCRRRLHASGIAPEIVGRIGRFLVYRSLSPETRAKIMVLAIEEVAQEYGLRVAYVEPSVIVKLMQRAPSQNFGIRPERCLIDEALGTAFAKAAEQSIPEPVKVVGPPYKCKHYTSAESANDEQDRNKGAKESSSY